jgi:hypothetical protein
MKIFFTLVIIVAMLFAAYHFTMAAYGWYEIGAAIDETAKAEVPVIADRLQQGGGFGVAEATRDRTAKIHEAIMKTAEEYKVVLKPDDISIAIADGMLVVKVNWDAPLAIIRNKTYLEIPMSVSKSYSLARKQP